MGYVMTYQKYLISGALIAFGALAATPANASYMSKCNELITKWQTCKETSGNCRPETNIIVKECKCHSLKSGKWKLVTAAVGKDGVCNATYPYDDTPQPGDPRPEHGNLGKGSWDIKGNDTKDRGGPKKGNQGRGNEK